MILKKTALIAGVLTLGVLSGVVIDQVVPNPVHSPRLIMTSSGGSDDGVGSVIFAAIAATLAKFFHG